jgi:hypothetical protein
MEQLDDTLLFQWFVVYGVALVLAAIPGDFQLKTWYVAGVSPTLRIAWSWFDA